MIQQNWYILKNDPIIGERLPEKPLIIFRRAPNLKDMLTSSYIKESKTINSNLQGFFICARCTACKEVGNAVRNRALDDFRSDSGRNL